MTVASETNDESTNVWEARLREAARNGEPIDLATDPGNQNPALAEVWGTDRQIPAAALRAMLIDPGTRVDPRGLWINGARITGGPVDLGNVQFKHPLSLTNCLVEDAIDLSGSTLKDLVLTGSHISSLHLDGARVDGCLFANAGFTAEGQIRALGARISGQLVLNGATLTNPGGITLHLDKATIDTGLFIGEGFTSEGEVRAIGARIGGELALNGATLTNPKGIALNLDGATVDGGIFAPLFVAEGAVRALNAHIGGELALNGATLTNPKGIALHLDGVTIDGGLFAHSVSTAEGKVCFNAEGEVRALNARIRILELDNASLRNPGGVALSLDRANVEGAMLARSGFTTMGEVRALNAHIGGQLSLNGATLTNPGRLALNLDGVTIDGGVLARAGFTAEGEVRALKARIGTLELNGATLTNPKGIALHLDGVTIDGGLFAREGFTAKGEVRALNAHIGGQLSLNGATLTNPKDIALHLDGVTIDGGLFAREGFTAKGEVRAVNAHIDTLELDGATLTNPTGIALHLDRANIASGLFAREGFTAEGEVRALNAHIDTLELNGATLTNPTGIALHLDRANIASGLFAGKGFTAEGEVCAVGARIDGELSLNGATLTNPDGIALHLDGVSVTTLRMARTQVDGRIDLTRATITDLRTPEKSIPNGRLIATGWQITDIHGLIRTDRRAAERWLDTAPPTVEFTAQPLYTLAGVYDRNGQPADARQLRFVAANKVTRHAPWYSKPLRWLYLLVAGHGYYPLLATVWLLAALSLGTALVASHRMDFVPTDPSAAHASAQSTGEPLVSPITADVTCTRYPTYPCFEPLTYTLTNVIPASSLNPRPDWRAETEASLLITFGLPILRILSWIFTAILLAGVTGLLRKT